MNRVYCTAHRQFDGRRCRHAPHPGSTTCWAHQARGAGLARKMIVYVPPALWKYLQALVATGLFGETVDEALLQAATDRVLDLFGPLLTPRRGARG